MSDPDQTAPLEGFERGGEGGAVHGEESCDCCYARWFRAIKRHHEGKLAVGQTEGAERFIEATCQGARRPLHVKTETAVTNAWSGFERDGFGA